MSPDTRPHGAWPSPLSPEDLSRAALRLGSPTLADDGSVFWLEGRPAEGGRTVLVRRQADGTIADVVPPPGNVRSRVHEYGGGAYAVAPGPEVFFVELSDQAIYRQPPGGQPVRLTTADWRFGDLVVDPARPRLLAVGERDRPGDEPENALLAIDRASGAVEVLVRGADFYAAPTPSPDGARLAWLSWNHPHLPWDAASLQVADLDGAGRPGPPRHLAGDARASAQQPAFGADGVLWFLYEANGYWNLWREGHPGPRPVTDLPAELGTPLWNLGASTWGFLDERTALFAAIEAGRGRLHTCDLESGEVRPIASDLTAVGHLVARRGRAALLVGFADRPAAVALLDREGTHRRAGITVLRTAMASLLDPAHVSFPEPIAFPTSAGDTAHAFFYPPRNPAVQPPPGEQPPLLVLVHGGPTSLGAPAFSPAVQFWTTRGFAVLDVNYRGSTGYGRVYRDRLKGNWGVYDVDDCRAGAQALCDAGRVDPRRIAIRGGSAGGYTVLAALVGTDRFAAGACHYGISDLAALARETHKFESHYTDSLIAPFAERPDLYRERSPITHADRLRAPVIFFQGLDDRVVPPDQTEGLYQALRARGLPAEYHAFPGEQHGFRRAETLRQVMSAELAFYGRVFGFAPA